MFDAEEYFAQVEKRLRSCRGAKIDPYGPKVTPVESWEKWEAIVWRAHICWEGQGEVLEVVDAWSRRRKKRVMHDFSYHFMCSDGSCIFRLDTHGHEIPYDGPCHIHIGPGEEAFEDGDVRLKGLTLAGLNFLDAFGWVHKYLKAKKLPWE
jgi:hypothetical protein